MKPRSRKSAIKFGMKPLTKSSPCVCFPLANNYINRLHTTSSPPPLPLKRNLNKSCIKLSRDTDLNPKRTPPLGSSHWRAAARITPQRNPAGMQPSTDLFGCDQIRALNWSKRYLFLFFFFQHETVITVQIIVSQNPSGLKLLRGLFLSLKPLNSGLRVRCKRTRSQTERGLISFPKTHL